MLSVLGLKDLLALDERNFHQALVNQILKSGQLGDVFPAMVTYNVPLYLLKKLWPESLQQIAGYQSIAFAAAEEGWKGKIESIRSKIDANGNLEYSKSYVISAEKLVLLVQAPEFQKKFALALINLSDVTQKIERPEIELTTSSAQRIPHYRIEGRSRALAFQSISQSAYSRQGSVIPLREASSLAILAEALLRRAEAGTTALENQREEILQARSSGKINRSVLAPARAILNAFYKSGIEKDLFWNEINIMLSRIIADP